ncbi:hypothetical protein [Xanthobacter flavus]|uniref:hypothetical protein n=1 Tax=Xanthobacter flavus TaxID=281 RepID=UPI0037277CB1
MVAALTKGDFERLFEAPPAHDWTAAFEAVEDLNAFARKVDEFSKESKRWISGMQQNFEKAAADIHEKVAGVPLADVRVMAEPAISRMIEAVEDCMKAHGEPIHERAAGRDQLSKLRQISGPTGRYLRKVLNRLEDVRVERYNALVDLYYGLLALRSEFAEKDGPSFSDGSSLRDFLRSKIA